MDVERTAFTSLQARWLASSLGGVPHPETRAACDTCPMVEPHPSGDTFVTHFNRRLKCCTYQPRIPNFLAGAVLSAPDAGEGSQRLADRVRARKGATPLALHAPPSWERLTIEQIRWGRDAIHRCPFAIPDDNPGCGLWPWRNAVCATWCCRHARRYRGRIAWRRIQAFLSEVEHALAADALLALAPQAAGLLGPDGKGMEPDDRALRGAVEADGTLDAAFHAALWRGWNGREEDYYRACWDRVRDLSWDEIRGIGGVRLEHLRRGAADAMSFLDGADLPDRLSAGRLTVDFCWTIGPDGRTWCSHMEDPDDPLQVDPDVREILEGIRDMPVDDVAALVSPHAAPMSGRDLALLLYDSGLLVSPREAAGDTASSFEPGHRLRVAPGIRLRHEVRFLPDGRAIEVLACGSVEIELDDPSMLGVGRRLVQFQHGFTASDVSGWPTEALPWERVAETLEALLSLGVIEHVHFVHKEKVLAHD